MTNPPEDLLGLDRFVHEPARLAILTTLSGAEKADFLFLLNVTGLTKGNLSSHLSKLERAGLVRIEKRFEGRQPVTYVKLTADGRQGLDRYWLRMEQIRRGTKKLRTLKPLKGT